MSTASGAERARLIGERGRRAVKPAAHALPLLTSEEKARLALLTASTVQVPEREDKPA